MVQITKAQLEKATKIIVVIYHSGLSKWYLFTLENMESLVLEIENIYDIQIIEQGQLQWGTILVFLAFSTVPFSLAMMVWMLGV
jgi:hypothetical protein